MISGGGSHVPSQADNLDNNGNFPPMPIAPINANVSKQQPVDMYLQSEPQPANFMGGSPFGSF